MTERLPYVVTTPQSYNDGFINRLGIIPVKVIGIGQNWFKDPIAGIFYHVIKDMQGYLVDEIRHSKLEVYKKKSDYWQSLERSRNRPSRAGMDNMPHEKSHIVIQCEVCGADREIKTCDYFQVRKCKPCQRIAKNERRKREIKIMRENQKKLFLETLVDNHRKSQPKFDANIAERKQDARNQGLDN